MDPKNIFVKVLATVISAKGGTAEFYVNSNIIVGFHKLKDDYYKVIIDNANMNILGTNMGFAFKDAKISTFELGLLINK